MEGKNKQTPLPPKTTIKTQTYKPTFTSGRKRHRQSDLRRTQYINLLFSHLPYLQNQCTISGFHVLSFYFHLVLGKLKCIIPGGLICPTAKL